MLDRFPTFLAASTFFVMALSVTHEWGYFSIIGVHFQTLLSAYDYLAGALLWLPYIFIVLFVLSMLQLFELRGTDFKWLPTSPLEKRLVHFVGVMFLLLAILSFLFLPPRDVGWLYSIAFCYIWSIFCGYVLGHERLASRLSFGSVVLAVFAPMMLVGVYVLGVTEGYNDMRRTDASYLLQPNKDGPFRPVIVLKSFEKGVLVRGEHQQVEFHKWSDIVSLAHTPPEPSDRSHACRRFGLLCDWKQKH